MTGGLVLAGIVSAAVAIGAAAPGLQPGGAAPAQDAPRFRSSVDLVSVAAVVRDRRGRFVTDLSRQDFEIIEAGERRPILNFRAELDGPVKLALLVDVSGSMSLGQRAAESRQVASLIFSNLSGEDEAAVYTFDTRLAEAQPFTSDRRALAASLDTVGKPFGQTSLYDAIAKTAQMVTAEVAEGPTRLPLRGAVAVLTDGIDTHSSLTAREVAVAASGIDVPVYIVAVMAGVDDPRVRQNRRQAAVASDLQELARGTGGELFIVSAPADAQKAAQQMVGELRHQYVLAFESSGGAGWRPLEVRTRQNELVVRARTGYSGGARLSEEESRGE